MPRISICLLILLFSCRDADSLSSTECGGPCFTAPFGSPGKGICKAGQWRCVDNRPVECVGEVLPEADACDGIDNKCTGTPDSDADWEDPRTGKLCQWSSVGMCSPGTTSCVNGEVVCVGGQGPQEERCDIPGDWDCDGIKNNIKPQVCYSGNPIELTYPKGICRAGISVCSQGQQICQGEILPVPERCNPTPVDFNCDGITNNVMISAGPMDIVFLLNLEGPAVSVLLDNWRSALKQVVSSFASDDYRYALVRIDSDLTLSALTILPLSRAQQVLPELPLLAPTNNTIEPVSNIITWIVTDRTILGFRDPGSTSRLLVVFADDDDDYFGEVAGNASPAKAVRLAVENGFRILVFAPYTETYYSLLADPTGGEYAFSNLSDVEIAKKISAYISTSGCP